MNIDRMKNLLFDLCSIPSISETPGEIEMAEKIYETVMNMDYFKNNPANAGINPIKNDPFGRYYVHALMEGKPESKKTVILLSHFDVVNVEDYGAYKDYAFKPLEYTELLKNGSGISLSKEAETDLASGDYIFGRGIMDMKFGLALDVEIMHQIGNKLDNFPGNILLLSVPDEENNSAGMLASVEMLAALKNEKGLEYVCCIVSEPHFPKYPGDNSKYIYTGAVGKLLPVFYCVGKETHAGDPFSGLNPNLLTAKIIEEIELNPELSDVSASFRTPAPVCLKQSDTKNSYSVSTPAAAYTYFNFITVTSSPDEVLNKLMGISKKTFEEVLHNIENKADRLQALTGSKPKLPSIKPMVITFRELYKMCLEVGEKEFDEHMESFVKKSPESDLRELSVDIVREAHKFCPYRDPMIVLFLAPPYYPHSGARGQNGKIAEITTKIIKKANSKYGVNLYLEPFFPGLSDMSYLGLPDNIDVESLKTNLPLWGDKYTIPLDAIASLNIPFMNIGPLGKDAHKYTERINIPYSFEIASKLVFEAVLSALDASPEDFGI
ncbi:MAG TPA: M20/M25/M40 family metallo-hydrolase [Bacillota bacterium]|nr:M20/M25/M40 family metallo-hydrolase [Clostridiaceae bacterium]HNR04971.1 M20/M25/M40 family metallo-hydrolase [Bacillota bacterium]HNT04479.1 M20/M25/M40 family metallo-hydrolase [Bacillota bacterium]HPA54814.1 M20/M25/M40 family metallo-hydrolase [Bacillota bacterium]HPX67896.1 M20/M25/M40 family metallo-hydrolase [Bacillota bacterium]